MSDFDNAIKFLQRRAFVLGKDVAVINIPYILAPQILDVLLITEPIAFCYCDTPEGIEFYFKERDDNTLEINKLAGPSTDKWVVRSFALTVKEYVDATKRGNILLYPNSPDAEFSNGRT